MKEYKIVCDIKYEDGMEYKQAAPILRNGARSYTIYKDYNEAYYAIEKIIESGRQHKPYSVKPPIQSNYVIVSREVSEWTTI